tara:strand:+ start:619 stop:876 length:258 start_codon:yes stop_codon:yes gene_type:complete
MPLPVLAAAAAKLGIEVSKYLIGSGAKKVLKKGATVKLRKQIAAHKNKSSNVKKKSPKNVMPNLAKMSQKDTMKRLKQMTDLINK